MSTKEFKKINMFFDKHFCSNIAFVNPNIETYGALSDNWNRHFAESELVKGIVAFGSNYPLSGCDMSIEDLIKFIDAYDDAYSKKLGVISENILDKKHFIYNNKYEIKLLDDGTTESLKLFNENN